MSFFYTNLCARCFLSIRISQGVGKIVGSSQFIDFNPNYNERTYIRNGRDIKFDENVFGRLRAR